MMTVHNIVDYTCMDFVSGIFHSHLPQNLTTILYQVLIQSSKNQFKTNRRWNRDLRAGFPLISFSLHLFLSSLDLSSRSLFFRDVSFLLAEFSSHGMSLEVIYCRLTGSGITPNPFDHPHAVSFYLCLSLSFSFSLYFLFSHFLHLSHTILISSSILNVSPLLMSFLPSLFRCVRFVISHCIWLMLFSFASFLFLFVSSPSL